MSVDITFLTPGMAASYESFVRNHPQSLLYYSLDYRAVLSRILRNSTDLYLVARRDGNVVGILPSFIQEGASGRVLNSLPFYGSNAGPLVEPGSDAIAGALTQELYKIAAEQNVAATTLISNPLSQSFLQPEEFHGARHLQDVRIGQFTPLPDPNIGAHGLMAMLHQKTRNMVRKGQSSNATFSERTNLETLTKVHSIHVENMQEIGGLSKPLEALSFLFEVYATKGELKIYVAEKNGKLAAAVVLLFFRDTVEYYMPVIRAEFRADQLLSALIFEAMRLASEDGRKLWNWGGTWRSQEGVYRFKSRWGTIDHEYVYDVRIIDPSLLTKSRQELLREYPNFYVLPFSELTQE